jgi:ligand-binding SRPBCC domain-containing protein
MSSIHRLERSQRIRRPIGEVFPFFADAANLEAITPGFLRFRITSSLPIQMKEGAEILYSLSMYGIPFRWRTRITDWQPGMRFVDEQAKGPFALWRHVHTFEAQGPNSTLMRDEVAYKVPFGPLGDIVNRLLVRRTVAKIFDHRFRKIQEIFEGRADDAQSRKLVHE